MKITPIILPDLPKKSAKNSYKLTDILTTKKTAFLMLRCFETVLEEEDIY